MIRFLFHDLGWKLASLFLAVVVWGLVSAEPEIETVLSVPVQYANRSPNLEVSSDYRETIKLELRGSSGRLRDLNNTKPAVVLNFANVREPGERTFPVTERNANLPRGVQLVRAEPSELHFTFERSLTRTVPVQVRFSGLPGKATVSSAVAVPSEVSISGPESRVRAVNFATTDPLDLATIKGDTVRTSAVYIPEVEVHLVGRPFVQIRVTVARR
jgi:YbbR domain-containing protein